ncbi:hypothetical protein J437_LFUL005225 [Ladona fulva]|uniref:Uncharacterized protein n=1 Tax=Ladona fulva TaxID=123851 RepID=A0A8K0KF92_LADFU|nr:hypothetical protein J437_LFUL005225 [Ladona fulva]
MPPIRSSRSWRSFHSINQDPTAPLGSYMLKLSPTAPREEEKAEEDAPVQGPLPFEPDDAPWKRSDSGIRKL